MMRRLGAIALAAALVGGLFAIPAAPAGAQNGDSMLDAPRLGFEIDPRAGHVGDTVAAQVNPADVQEHCMTEMSELNALFFDADHPDAVDNRSWRTPGPVFADYMSFGPLIDINVPDEWPVQDLFPPFIPPTVWSPDPAWVDPLAWAWQLTYNPSSPTFVDPAPWSLDTPERLAALALWFFFDSVLGNPTEAGLAGEGKQAVLEASMIVTFVDPVTQELVGEMGGFDAATGSGSVEVPELDPGLWAVAAACVEPAVTEESFLAAISAGADWVIDEGIQLPVTNLLQVPPYGLGEVVELLAPVMLPELMVPRALGIDFYCILNEEGFCATPPDPVGLLAELSEEELAEFADLQAGDSAGDGDAGPAGLSAEPVSAAPAFTG